MCAGAILRPRRTYARLLADPRQLRYGTTAFLLISLLYTLTVVGLAWSGVSPGLRPWGWTSRRRAMFGFVLPIPLLLTWTLETLITLPPLTGFLSAQFKQVTQSPAFLWAYQLAALGWYLILAPLAARAAQKLRWWQALIIGDVAVLVALFLMVLFIR